MIMNKVLEELLDKFENGTIESNESKLGNLNNKQIMLYGAGNVGKKLYKNLRDNNIEIACFIDRNKNIDQSKYEVPVYQPESKELEVFKKTGYVILSALFSLNVYNGIKKYLLETGFYNIFGIHEINFSAIGCKSFYSNLFNNLCSKNDVVQKNRSKIIEAFSLLETEQDKELYIECLKSHLTMNFTEFKEPYDISMQYLAHDIPVEKDYRRFIDCGGFDGDTIRNFISQKIEIENIAIFEPQNDLCEKITTCIDKNSSKFNLVTIFPCGVHSKTEKLKFSVSDDAPSVSKIHEKGSDIIQCVAIDDVLKGFNATFIKMDIEGAEIEALKGAKQTIVKNHPQLAICVYHSLSDIWEIPLLIKSFYSKYKFYLRNYNFMGLETVLYAFPED